jgi:DNA-binding HxlR family transcriptional regulator
MRECVIYKTMNIIGKKWTVPILLEIYKGKRKKRFGEIKKEMEEITPKILSTRLKELEKEGLIKKEVDNSTIPIKCEYSLTESGNDLVVRVDHIKKWALKWKFKNKECGQTLCKNCEN